MSSGNVEHRSRFNPIAWMAGNSIAANLLMLVLLGGGIITAFTIQKEVYPEFELGIVEVMVEYPGASPEEVEKGILQPVEEAVRGVQGIKEMTSTAREGSGMISLELVSGLDRMKAFQDIDQAVNRIRTFPVDAEEPEVSMQVQQRDVMELGLYGDVEIWTLRKLAEQLRDRLVSEPAITQVEIGGVPDYVTHVEIPKQTLRQYGITLSQVAEMIEQASQDVPAGEIKTNEGEILVRVKERKQWAEEYGQIPVVTNESGDIVYLADIATIYDGFEEAGFHSQFNRQPSVEIEIFRVGQQSPLEIAQTVEGIFAELDNTLPEGVSYRIDSNRAEDFNDRLFLLLDNGWMAIVIVLIILSLFLEYRLAFWIMMGMTISFVGGIMFLPMIGVSINMISMFAFLVVLGIVVDDAIVVGENIHEYRQQGIDGLSAAIKGAQDIAAPVTFTILTTIVAFLPVMFMPGTTGLFWWPLPAVVITVLLISLVEALFILPAHLAHSKREKASTSPSVVARVKAGFADGLERFIKNRYKPFLTRCLRHRYLTLVCALCLLAVTGAFATSDHLGIIMMPREAANEIEAGVRLPVGTTDAKAAEVAQNITNATYDMFQRENLFEVAEGIKTNVRGESFIDVEIVLLPPDERTMSAIAVIELWREQIGDIEGVNQITFETERGPGGWRDDISVDLSHNDLEMLGQASQRFVELMKAFSQTRDVNDSYRPGKMQLDFTLLPAGEALGLTPEYVGRQIRDAFYGAVALRQLRGTNEVEVRVKLPRTEREQQSTLDNFILMTPSGGEVPLMDVVKLKESESYSALDRRDGRRVITVGMDVEPAGAVNQVLDAINQEVLPQLLSEYPGLTWTFRGSQAEMRESTSTLWIGFSMAMFVIYSLLAIAFRSYTQPFIVMLAIPFGAIGAVAGHVLFGYDLSIVSLMGLVALSGVVVNGALIMVDYANRRATEIPVYDAIVEAGVRRFRPIALTTMTTFGGLTPIILEQSRQAYQLIPMAISLGFGIVFATAIMSIIVPCFYLILEDIKSGMGSLSDADTSKSS
ncbi:efflux RND transporter permease subunit [Salinimonas sp. HHU 13199]|uniref:Efflux RND transporter permease subunit n=1 Tax=Salinimonas profundi TaxID=2729140 RepID=A0ABR8LJ40_9ALTE|nr:efflux RND transporter permease subunit [Salinimonas profundi]MBD3584951.1 efflux RND transporter permease subunit [Salinimonas profundi]